MNELRDEGFSRQNIRFSEQIFTKLQSERHSRTCLSVHVEDLFTSIFDAKRILAHIDSKPEAIPSGLASIDPIIDSGGGVAAGGPLRPACLGAGPGWVRPSVLSVCDPEVRVVGLDLDGLDRVRDVGVVGERAVPDGKAVSV